VDNILPTEVQYDLPAVVRGMNKRRDAEGLELEVLEVMLLGRRESRPHVLALIVKHLYRERIVAVTYDVAELELREIENDGSLQPAA
jgi:hypothetical protein